MKLFSILTSAPAIAVLLAAGGIQPAAANTALWIGVSGTSTTTNWSDNANWSNSSGGGPGPNGNDVVFGDPGAVGTIGQINSVVDQNLLNPFSLTFTNGFTGSLAQTVLIPTGISVTNANGLVVGKQSFAAANYIINAAIVGGGSLVQKGNITVDNSTTTGGSSANLPTLDLSGLSNFVALAINTLNIAGSGSESRGQGKLNLAATNIITATNITMNTTSGNANGTGGTLNLGSATNVIYTTTLIEGQTKGSANVIQFFGPTGGLRMRGVTGADSDRTVSITLGDRNNTGSGTTSGQMLFNGHQVDIKATTLVVGQDRSSSSASTHAGSGVVQFDTGILDVTTITMANGTSAAAAASANGTILVGTNATLVVGTGGIQLGNKGGSVASATATLTLDSGTLNASGNLAKANAGAVANFNMTNGVLTIAAGKTLGVLGTPIDNVYQNGATNNLTPGSGVVIFANNLITDVNSNVINIPTLPIITSYPKQYSLISYAGTIGGSGFNYYLGSLPSASPSYQGYISNNAANLSIDLVVTAGPIPIGIDVWNGTANNLWDLSSVNWTNLGSPVAFHQGDAVQLDDTATGSFVVSLATNVNPGSLTVSNLTHAYTLGGSGAVVGSANLAKYGAASLTLTNSGINTFNGGITINAGKVQFGNGGTNGVLPANAQAVTDNGNLALDLSSSFPVFSAISGTGTLTQSGSGAVSLVASNSYSGTTTVAAGTLLVDGYIGGGGVVTNAPGATLGGTNTIIGTLNADGPINPGDVNGIGTLTVNGNTTLYPGAGLFVDLNAGDNTIGNGVNDLLALTGTGNLNANNNTITINVRGVPLQGATYGVITYAGTLTGTFNPTVAGTHYGATVDSTPANQVNVVINGSSGANMKWTSTSSTSWDNVTANWLNTGTALADDFFSGDTVLMDDSVVNVQTNLVIPSGVTMYPTIVSNISSTANYTISGAPIGGSASLVKDGSSTLTVNDNNTFTGTVDVYGGTLKTGSGTALGTTAAGTTVHPGATLDVNGSNLGAELVTVSGTGVGGLGAIVNSGLQQVNALKNVTLAGDTTFGGGSALTNAGAGRWDIRGGGATLQASGSPVNITKVGTNQVSLVACVCSDVNLENVYIQQGEFAIQTSSTQLGDPNGFIYVSTNAILDVYALTAGLNKNVWLLDGGEIFSENSVTALSGTLTLTNNALNTAPGTGIINNNSGTALNIISTIQGPGNLSKIGSGITFLSSANTYTGNTTVGAGTLFLTNSGSITTTPTITVSAGATLDVSMFAPYSLATSQTLQGGGTVKGDLSTVATSAINPGTPTALGTLTVLTNVTLGGSCTVKVSRASGAASDTLVAGGTMAFGGTLTVTSMGGTYQNGDTFTLFKATNGFSGTFASTNLPALGTGLTWVTTNLANGVLSVLATVNTNPTNITVAVGTGSMTLSWPADHTGWRLLSQTNPVTKGLSTNWNTVAGSASVNSVIVPLTPSNGTVFYRLVYP